MDTESITLISWLLMMNSGFILSENQIKELTEKTQESGSFVSYKENSDGTKSPYELNITYFDVLVDKEDSLDLKVRKFINVHSILLTFREIPAIYIHSLLDLLIIETVYK